jgi:hypothetical protein
MLGETREGLEESDEDQDIEDCESTKDTPPLLESLSVSQILVKEL